MSLPASGAAARGCVTRLGLRADSGPVRLPPLLAGGEGFIGLGIGEKLSPIQGSILSGRAHFQAFGLRYTLFDPLSLRGGLLGRQREFGT